MYDPRTIYIPPGYGKIRFSRIEMKNILLAVGALTLAFTIFFYYRLSAPGLGTVGSLAFAFGVSLAAILTGFMLHEFAHKVMAQRNGAWAEFRAYPLGLLLAVFLAVLGFIFAAPGAVYIQGMINRKQNGIISIAGPLVNIAIGLPFLTLGLLLDGSLLGVAFHVIGWINILLAAFNMLPIPPFDGYKVLKWNLPIYIVSAVAMGVPALLLIYPGLL